MSLPMGDLRKAAVLTAAAEFEDFDALMAVLGDPCLRKLSKGEPFFAIVGRDLSAAPMMQHWLRANPQIRPEKASRAIETADKMRDWKPKKPAD